MNRAIVWTLHIHNIEMMPVSFKPVSCLSHMMTWSLSAAILKLLCIFWLSSALIQNEGGCDWCGDKWCNFRLPDKEEIPGGRNKDSLFRVKSKYYFWYCSRMVRIWIDGHTHDVTTDHDPGGSRTWTLTLSPGWWPSGHAPPTACWRPSAGATQWRRWGPGCQMTWGQWSPSPGIITPCGQVQCPETDRDGLHRGGGLAWAPSVGQCGVSVSGDTNSEM